MTWAICFDLPTPEGDLSGQPCFGGAIGHDGTPVPAFFPTLESAAKFNTEIEAEAFLRGVFAANIRQYGVVVEVGA